MVKRILNTTTGRYYKLREKTTSAGTAGQIMGLWSPKRTVKTSKREKSDSELCNVYIGDIRAVSVKDHWRICKKIPNKDEWRFLDNIEYSTYPEAFRNYI